MEKYYDQIWRISNGRNSKVSSQLIFHKDSVLYHLCLEYYATADRGGRCTLNVQCYTCKVKALENFSTSILFHYLSETYILNRKLVGFLCHEAGSRKPSRIQSLTIKF